MMTPDDIERVTFSGTPSGRVYYVVRSHAGPKLLPTRFDLVQHSPDGYAWGYLGSGPAQLAAAMTSMVLGDEAALAFNTYQHIKERLIAPLRPDAGWQIPATTVMREGLRYLQLRRLAEDLPGATP